MTAIDLKIKKAVRIEEVSELINKYGDKYLNDELKGYCNKLIEDIGRKNSIDMTKGKIEVWATAVVLVIARLNFLFDKKSSNNYITMESVYEFFSTKRGAVGLRAEEIEKVCKINIGQAGLCSENISDELTFMKLPNGMVITKGMAKKSGLI